MVSAQTIPMLDTKPERCPLLSVRWIHNTATGPTVTDEARPTQNPPKSIFIISTTICSIQSSIMPTISWQRYNFLGIYASKKTENIKATSKGSIMSKRGELYNYNKWWRYDNHKSMDRQYRGGRIWPYHSDNNRR